jgi:VanZ family protein
MCLIFTASTGAGSFQNSSRILAPLLHWLFPAMPQPDVNRIVFLIRKCAHMTEYAILALVVWRAIRKPIRNDPRPWSWGQALAVALLVLLYASSDEFHQRFVPGRDASLRDVMLDTIGGVLGLLIIWAFWRSRRCGLQPSRQQSG